MQVPDRTIYTLLAVAAIILLIYFYGGNVSTEYQDWKEICRGW